MQGDEELMTTEIVQYKCPSCGHLLGEEEFKHACEKSQRQVDEKVEQKLIPTKYCLTEFGRDKDLVTVRKLTNCSNNV